MTAHHCDMDCPDRTAPQALANEKANPGINVGIQFFEPLIAHNKNDCVTNSICNRSNLGVNSATFHIKSGIAINASE